MNTPFKITIEHIIIIVLLAMLFLKSCEKEKDCGSDKIDTITKEVTLTVRDSAKSVEIKNQVPEKVNIIEFPHKIKKVKNVSKLSMQDRKKVKVVNRYQDTTHLDHATIYSDILSEGRILENSIIADVDHTITTTTTKETIIKQPMGLFISPGVDYSPLSGLEGVETSIMFIKGNWGASFGGYYHFRYRNPLGLKITLHIKL